MAMRRTLLEGDELVNVAGESHYQEALRSLTGTETGSVRVRSEATLVREPENPHDPAAIRVEIEGHLVGYVPRALAQAYGPLVESLAARGRAAACEAVISGRSPGDGPLGVFLRLPRPGGPDAGPPPTRGSF